MIKPMVHLNGSGKENLLNGFKEVYSACAKACEALQQAFPHERDYYTLPMVNGVNAYQIARQEHVERIKAVQDVMDQMVALAESVQS